MSMPDDLRIAYENFTLLATAKGFVFSGMMMSIDPPAIMVIGNVNEKGHDLARLFREYAKLLDEKTESGQIEPPEPTDTSKVN